MKKCIALLTALALVIVVISGIALAAADVQKLVPYKWYFGFLAEDASGKAVVNYPEGDVVLQITVSVKGLNVEGLDPEKTYEVKSCTSLAECLVGHWTLIGYMKTNKNGNGHFHRNYREGEDLPPTPHHIYINATGSHYNQGIILIDEDALL